ncbi:MAG: MFS transporter, partial [Phycisphaerales bacterium]|nr:MFS transporter [Phycisphaerales bacterium]
PDRRIHLLNPLQAIRGVFGSFLPSSMPYLTRASYARELPAWALLPVMTGILEGGVVGVIVQKLYDGVVPDELLYLIIAFLTGLQATANVFSFAWAALSHRRGKIKLLVGMQLGCALCTALPALASNNLMGMWLFVIGVVGARLCWSGVITLRSAVWASNYPREVRARIAGKFATIQALVLAGVSALIGVLMDWDQDAYRWAYPLAAVIGILGTAAYSRIRMRGHAALLRDERNASEDADAHEPSLNPLRMLRFLRSDIEFTKFMSCQFLLGTGNMMIGAPLIIVLTTVYMMDYLQAIAIMTTIPILLMPLSIPLWSRFLNRVHIIRFRAVHSWIFVVTTTILVISIATGWLPGLWIAAVIRGIAFGGGVLAWNLGHLDFSSVSSASTYMGVHVTLTGLRGLLAPPLGVLLYELLKPVNPTGSIVFCVALSFILAGAIGFVLLSRRLKGPSGLPESD